MAILLLASGFLLGILVGLLLQRRHFSRIVELERAAAALENEKQNLERRFQLQKEEWAQMQSQLSAHFENLAQKILDQKSVTFREASEKNLTILLNPLKERIQEFQKRVEETYSQESRERFSLQKEIEKIVLANQQITQEANHLTQALRGDVKAQGTWGEIVLDRVLEASGLREGEEFVVQGKDLDLKDAEGHRLRPDVVVNLPDEKHLIVDSKVSLVHYERYLAGREQDEREKHLRDFLTSLYGHIDDLGSKNYHGLDAAGSPHFVMMFVPIEGAFSLALQSDPQVLSYAWDKLIVVVSPTTLLACLKTVSSLWQLERQNRHAVEIATQGGRLYDKFVNLIDDLEKVGDYLSKSQGVYSEAMNKLQYGRGNLISRVEHLKNLGAKASKSLPSRFSSGDLEDTGEVAITPPANENALPGLLTKS